MTNQEAKHFIDKVFYQIVQAKSIKDLEEIELKFEEKYKMDTTAYPKINYSLKPHEIDELVNLGILDEAYQINPTKIDQIDDPLTKLLYALIWKNGDLKKIKHIARAVHQPDQTVLDQDSSFVFYQFGKHLTKESGEPIIDQHVLRSFALYHTEQDIQHTHYRKMNVISNKEKELIRLYKEWLVSDAIPTPLKESPNYIYYIDRILFAAGRKTKKQKTRLVSE